MSAAQARRSAPIGVFDSGLGGLTVVRRLQRALPQERLVFVADQANVPYGGRDLNEVCGFACGLSDALLGYGCKAIVMACNISSATGLTVVQTEHPDVPVLGVIEPGARAGVAVTRTGRIGVLATAGTVRSGAYTRGLKALRPDCVVTEIACPDFVPLVEAGQENAPAAYRAAETYLAPLLEADVDTVILGCTHYPFLLEPLTRLAPGITFVDPADATAQTLQTLLATRHLACQFPLPPPPLLPHLLTTTGDAAAFAHQLARFLPDAARNATVASAHWKNGILSLPALPHCS